MIERFFVGYMGKVALRTSSALAATGLLGAVLAGCCFGGAPRTPPPPVNPPGVGGGTTVTPPTPTAASAITLAPGFAPDPTLVVGNAGGPVQASTMGAMCRGTIGTAPNVTLTTTAMISNLRIVVNAPQDTTLIVRLANGQVLCDDDGGGYPNPMVSGVFPPGQHQVYVGTYNPTATGVGFTTNPSVNAGSLGAAPPPTTFPPVGGAIPSACGLAQPAFGPLSIGSSVVLGAHTPYVGPDGAGGMVGPGSENELNWVPDMQAYVGQRTTITSLDGVDGAGCTVAKVAADNAAYYWRVRDMRL